ncbi:uncharacterized protein LOC111930378 [Cyanistes caeruleus]|uniref:uncharacterized protein LOC111930378 n=1 Tax=Cyanistes caeruleus TaxID=156563 RepID=UPI000CDA808C|nr:uncharacterized protein LOC111930378 [Cyanistes caeruleus]
MEIECSPRTWLQDYHEAVLNESIVRHLRFGQYIYSFPGRVRLTWQCPGQALLIPSVSRDRLSSSRVCPGTGSPHPQCVPGQALLIPSVSRDRASSSRVCPGTGPPHPGYVPGEALLILNVSRDRLSSSPVCPGRGSPHPQCVPGQALLIPSVSRGRLSSSRVCPGRGSPHPECVPGQGLLIPSVSRGRLSSSRVCPGTGPPHPGCVPGQGLLIPSASRVGSPGPGCRLLPCRSRGTSRWSSRIPIAAGTVKWEWKGPGTPCCVPVELPLALCYADELELGNGCERGASPDLRSQDCLLLLVLSFWQGTQTILTWTFQWKDTETIQ